MRWGEELGAPKEVNWLSDESAPVLSRSVDVASLVVVMLAGIVLAGG
jgi:hypothetical protein